MSALHGSTRLVGVRAGGRAAGVSQGKSSDVVERDAVNCGAGKHGAVEHGAGQRAMPTRCRSSTVQNRYYASATPGVEAQAAPTNNSNDSAATRSARPRIVDSDESELDNNDTDTAAMRNASTSAQHTDECDADANVINEDAQPHTTPRISRTRPRSNPVRATPYSRIRRTLDEIPRRVTRGSRASSTSLREYEPIDQVCRCTGANTCCM